MKLMNKILIVGALLVLLIGSVSALFIGDLDRYNGIEYSEPIYNNGSAITWQESKLPPLKTYCPRNEWNIMFEDYRDGLISKEDMSKYIRGCKW